MEKLKCDNCGKPIKNFQGRDKTQKRNFCSRECYYQYLREGNIKGNWKYKTKQLMKIEELAKQRREILEKA